MRRFRLPLVVGWDVAAWVAAYAVFAWLRFDSDADQVPWTEVIAVALGSAGLFVCLSLLARLHQGRAATASLEEMVLLGTVALGAGGVTSRSTWRRSGSRAACRPGPPSVPW